MGGANQWLAKSLNAYWTVMNLSSLLRHGYVEPHHSSTTPLILTNLPGCLNMIGDLWTPYPQYLPPYSLKSMLIGSICQFLGIFGPTVSP